MIVAVPEFAFEIDVKLAADGSRIRITGEFETVAARRFKEITGALLTGGTTMVVDLDRATFIDSVALGALIGLRNQLTECGGTLTVVCSNRQIRTIFEATGLLAEFRIREAA